MDEIASERIARGAFDYIFTDFDKPTGKDMKVWLSMLSKVEPRILQQASVMYAAEQKFKPTIGGFFTVVKKLEEAQQQTKTTAEEALEITKECARRYGICENKKQERNVFVFRRCPKLNKFLKRTGLYKKIAMAESDTEKSVLETRFLKAWEAYENETKFIEQQLSLESFPAKVRALAKTTAKKLAPGS